MSEEIQAVQAVAYKKATGEIVRVVTCAPSVVPMLARYEDEAVMLAEGEIQRHTHFVINGYVAERVDCPVTLSGNLLSNIPAPAIVEIDYVPYECHEPTVELEFDQPGTYTVSVKAFPFKQKTFTVKYENSAL